MARSLSRATALTALCFSRRFAAAFGCMDQYRRFAAASPATGARAVERKAAEQKTAEPSSSFSSSSFGSWVPDPVTGYYKPGNLRMEVDPAELRAMHLSRQH